MNGSTPVLTCQSCGAQLSPNLLVCPGCGRLMHAAELTSLAQEASAAQQAGQITQALVCWRRALELLPPDTVQYATIRSQIEQLGRQIDAGGMTSQPKSTTSGTRAAKALTSLGFLGILIWKFKVVLFFALSKGKLLLIGLTKSSTFFSMFAFFAVYWTTWGWLFALGLVLSIYIHEMGHVDALRRYGFQATAPMFIPGIGALVRLRQNPVSPSENARIGLAGPVWGTTAAAACYLVFIATGAAIWAAISHVGAFINLFNLIPIGPLDGSRGFQALSRVQAWLVTAALGIAWLLTNEGLLLLVAIVAVFRSIKKSKNAPADRTAFVLFFLLIASLSLLVYIRVGVPG